MAYLLQQKQAAGYQAAALLTVSAAAPPEHLLPGLQGPEGRALESCQTSPIHPVVLQQGPLWLGACLGSQGLPPVGSQSLAVVLPVAL